MPPFLKEVSTASIIIRIMAAVLCGGLIGIERGRSNQAAGMRTYMLVCMGAAVVMLTGQCLYEEFQTGDPARLGAQVISGIGFLGAGSIIVSGKTKIRGLTTAAGLWVSACIGLSIGCGFIEVGVWSTAAVSVIMSLMKKVEDYFNMQACIYIETDLETGISYISESIRKNGLYVTGVKMNEQDKKNQKVILLIKNTKHYNHQRMLDVFRQLDGIKYAEYVS